MRYANVSVKFPEELDHELERVLDETGIYTNKSAFIKDAVRRRLEELNDDPAIAALRVEQLLARAEDHSVADEELRERLSALQESVDHARLPDAVEAARADVADEHDDRS